MIARFSRVGRKLKLMSLLKPLRWKYYDPLKLLYPSTRQHGDISKRTKILILTPVNTANPIQCVTVAHMQFYYLYLMYSNTLSVVEIYRPSIKLYCH
jgi:hypothetical protein